MKLKKGKLDYLLIPTGWNRQRKKRAFEELKNRNVKNILILNGDDSEEDILYLGKKLKGGERIGFVTFPLHYQEYKEIIKKAQKEKKFPRRVKTENIPTKETFKQFIYGILGIAEERMDKKVNYVKEEKPTPILLKLKYFIIGLLKK